MGVLLTILMAGGGWWMAYVARSIGSIDDSMPRLETSLQNMQASLSALQESLGAMSQRQADDEQHQAVDEEKLHQINDQVERQSDWILSQIYANKATKEARRARNPK